jgi:hypothetical protein
MKFWRYLFNTALPIGLVAVIGYAYKSIVCHYATDDSSGWSLICVLNWKDGIILLCCYSVVKIVSPLLGFDTIGKRILYTIGLYCIAYGLLAWPYLIASFFQPFAVNVFVHGLLLLLGMEGLFYALDKRLFARSKSRQYTKGWFF